MLLLPIILISSAQLTGCISAGKNALPRGGNMTMAEIFKHKTGLSTGESRRSTRDQSVKEIRKQLSNNKRENYVNYTRNSTNEIKKLFKRLPNPVISTYIYPHQVNDENDLLAIPGYTTAFFLYRKNHFAMPSENY